MFESPAPETKKCPGCGERKSLTEFGFNKRRPDGRSYYCRPCFNAIAKRSYRKSQAAKGKTVREAIEVPEGCKYCPQCKEVKPVEEFGRNRAAKSGMTDYCKPCHNMVGKANRVKHHGSTRNFQLKRRYGVTEAEVEAISSRQGGICLICLRSPAKHVDHDHLTGLFRGLLCFSCNGALGQFRDEIFRLREAAAYLEGRGSHARVVELELGVDPTTGFAGQTMRRHVSPDKLGTPRHYKLWQKYGLQEKDVQAMLRVQRGGCAICFDAPGRHVDHDHESTAVRGILCPECNSGMGQLRDDPGTLRRAADYLTGMLIEEVPTDDGATRPSFTYPDVDPVTVPLDAWEEIRVEDARQRRAVWDFVARIEKVPGREIVVVADGLHAGR